MIKKLLKKTFVYSLYKKYRKGKQKQLNLKEIKNRIANDTILKDLTERELNHWKERIDIVISSIDNQKINCVRHAGKLKGGLLVMHNGTVIEPLSYYGYPILKMLVNNKGIHEPQEEYVFQEVLKEMPEGATMIELGAYWSFYSMWFNKEVKNANNYMIEPMNLDFGIMNFKLNKIEGNFFQYFVAAEPSVNENGIKVISVDRFIEDRNIHFVDILHSDIQGDELLMLQGAYNLLSTGKAGYVFISTHSAQLHTDCTQFMDNIGYTQV